MNIIEPVSPSDSGPPHAERQPLREWQVRLLTGVEVLSRSPIARGAAVWLLLLGAAWLVGTLAIAPMIGEAAGLRKDVYDVSAEPRKSELRPEPAVMITPVATSKPAAMEAKPAEGAATEAKPKLHRKRHRRHHSLPADETYLGRSGGDLEKPEPRERRQTDGEESGGGADGGERDQSGGGKEDRRGDGIQRGQPLGDG
jgi:hypothetical protein